jgi:hypothetical protein
MMVAGRVVEPEEPRWLTRSVTEPWMIDGLEQSLRISVRRSVAPAISELEFHQTLKNDAT